MNPHNNLVLLPAQTLRKRSSPRWISVCLLFFFAWSLANFSSQAEEVRVAAEDLTRLPFEELVRVKVTTVSKRPESLFDSASAVYVISGEDIERSGYTSIAEALRLAPGMQVARLGSHDWAISSRGFAGLYANKLLVLMDGRSLYTPLNSGVDWDAVDTLLQDVERIEVVRGPGGTLWGANAVNGVVNIITKSARDTQGFYAEAGGGNFEQGFGGARYGGRTGDVFFRVYGKYFQRGEFELGNGNSADDDWQKGQGGFRIDWEPSGPNVVTLQGDFYSGTENNRADDTTMTGGNLLGRWTHDYSSDAQSKLQVYYDRFARDTVGLYDIETFDVDVQHQFCWGERQEIIFGAGYRLIHDDLESSPDVMFHPQSRTMQLPSAFVQDEILLWPDLLRLTLGAKVEHHYFSGWEIQPSARLLWTPDPNHTAWAAVSRAVRTPSRSEQDVRSNFAEVPGSPPEVYAADMRGRVESEEVLAYEIGYRIQLLERLSLDVAGFYNDYEHFATFEPRADFTETNPPPTHIVHPFEVRNKAFGETYGGELAVRWQATDWCRFDAYYNYLQIQLHAPHSLEPTAEFAERESPHHQVSLRSAMDLPGHTQLDCILRYVDSVPGFGVSSYVTMDVRFAWKPSRNWEIALVGQNLLDNRHAEFGDAVAINPSAAEAPRSFYAKVSCKF